VRRFRRSTVTALALASLAGAVTATPARAMTWQQRAVLYAPLLVLHRDEPFRPSTVQWALDRSVLKFSRDNQVDVRLAGRPNATQLGDRGPSTYGYVHNGRAYRASDCTRPRDGGCARNGLKPNEGFFLDVDDSAHGGPKTGSREIYYQYGPSKEGGTFLTYWFYFPYDEFRWKQFQAHEGDWERVVIRFDTTGAPAAVAYHHHNCYSRYAWGAVPKTGTHPIAYVAKSSHGVWTGKGGNCGGTPSDVTDLGGPRWQTWTGSVAWVRDRGFYGFGGAWGSVGTMDMTTGPMGPSQYKNYSEPF
jgi:hypothetical protein